jgi:hypothetical protein
MSAKLFPSSIQGLRSCAALPSCYVRAGQRSLSTSPAIQGLRSCTACPGAMFARDNALSALQPAFKGLTTALLALVLLKTFALFFRQMAAHTRRALPALGSRDTRLAAMHAAINPPNLAENIELPYLWLRNDGGTEPDRGHSVSFSLVRIPFRGKVARTISARHALLSEQILGKNTLQLTTGKLNCTRGTL